MLTRDSFLSGPRPALVLVNVPFLGGDVHVRQMTVGERDAFENANAADKAAFFRPRLAVASAVDADGVPLFKASDLQALAGLASHALEPIVEAATKLNRYTPEEVKALEGN